MAYRELTVVEVREVLRQWMAGRGFRSIDADLGIDRKTVRRYVEAAVELGVDRLAGVEQLTDELVGQVAHAVRPGAPSQPGAMRKHCQTHRKLIEGWVEDGVPAAKIVDLLGRQTRKSVPVRTLQRFIAEELGCGRSPRATVRIADGEPGSELQVDFTDLGMITDVESGRRRKLQALVCTAVYSRHMFVWPCFDQKLDTVIEGLDAAWAYFGGVFRVVIPDNLKTVVTRADGLEPRLCSDFLEYAQARGFHIDPARVRRPDDKPRVERSIDYVQGSYFAGEDFRALGEAREAALRWCTERAGARLHGTTHARPLEEFERDERPRLLPAPTEPYDRPRWIDSSIGRDGMVVADYAMYSVPRDLGPAPVRVRLDRATVRIYLAGELVGMHPRVARGGASVNPADLPEGVRELALRDGEALVRKAEEHGARIAEYTRRLLAHPLPWTRMRHVYRLLGLVGRYGAPAVERACESALALDVVDVMRIDRMLARALEERSPTSPSPPPPRLVPLRFARTPEEFRARPKQPEEP
jgi:transposase